ncbi:hypothetical protein DFH07DRAFT_938833 [Mycena maculata]|uniref:Uncharacterized protein n=1 Tax=Mycena maculata TaxID=230809 RepID=A0AAD7NLH1_9AGAR|nr:hypothetical protein DFH07DRAFT_938833 [Mycena maculata]
MPTLSHPTVPRRTPRNIRGSYECVRCTFAGARRHFGRTALASLPPIDECTSRRRRWAQWRPGICGYNGQLAATRSRTAGACGRSWLVAHRAPCARAPDFAAADWRRTDAGERASVSAAAAQLRFTIPRSARISSPACSSAVSGKREGVHKSVWRTLSLAAPPGFQGRAWPPFSSDLLERGKAGAVRRCADSAVFTLVPRAIGAASECETKARVQGGARWNRRRAWMKAAVLQDVCVHLLLADLERGAGDARFRTYLRVGQLPPGREAWCSGTVHPCAFVICDEGPSRHRTFPFGRPWPYL